MTTHQQELIKTLTQTNQSLLNQVRAKDIGALSGLQSTTGISENNADSPYTTTEDREMAAYFDSLSQSHLVGAPVELGEQITDEDLDIFRTGL